MKREKFGNRLVAGMEEGLDALKSNQPLPMMWRPSMPKPPALAGRHSVKNIRQSFGLTQNEFSRLMMVSTKTLQSWNRGYKNQAVQPAGFFKFSKTRMRWIQSFNIAVKKCAGSKPAWNNRAHPDLFAHKSTHLVWCPRNNFQS